LALRPLIARALAPLWLAAHRALGPAAILERRFYETLLIKFIYAQAEA